MGRLGSLKGMNLTTGVRTEGNVPRIVPADCIPRNAQEEIDWVNFPSVYLCG